MSSLSRVLIYFLFSFLPDALIHTSYHSLSFRPSPPLQNHLSCSSLARSLVSVISTIRLVLLRTTLTFLPFSFSLLFPQLCLLAPSCVGGFVAIKSLLVFSDKWREKKPLIAAHLDVPMLTCVRARFYVRLEMKCLGVDYTTRSISERLPVLRR